MFPKGLGIVGVLCLGLLAGCSMIPTISPFLSNRSKLIETNMDSVGVIAFVRQDQDPNLGIDIDVKNVTTEKKYRIDFDPPFFNYFMVYLNRSQMTSFDRRWRRDVISDSVAFFALPEGEYEPILSVYKVSRMDRLLRGDADQDMLSYKSVGTRFKVERGKVTSFGRVKIDFERPFFRKPVLNVYSIGTSINDDIRAVQEIKASGWEISEQEFRSSLK